MSKPIKYLPITDLLKEIVDNRGKTVPTAPEGTPLIATNCIKHSSIYPTFEKVRYVDDETLRTWFRAHLQPNDILFVNKGTPGRVCLVPDPVNFCAAQDMIGFRCDENKINYKYLFAVLRSREIQKVIENNHVGLVIPHFRKQDLPSLMIPIRSPEEQEAIGNLYITLSEKIELNQRINAELESMAKTLYDYWFVQFDFPNAEGKPYKFSGGKMVWNEELKRDVPAGWEVTELRKYLTSNRGVSYGGKDIINNGIPMINLNSFNTNSTYKPEGIKVFSGNYNATKVLKPFDLVMCNTQQTALDPAKDIIGKSFLVPDLFESDIVSSHHVTTISVEKELLKYYLNSLFNTEYFHRYISGYATGTNILGLNFEGVLSHRTAIPGDDLLIIWKSIIVNVEKQKSRIIKENQTLTELRDWLLPMLMNGQVKISVGH